MIPLEILKRLLGSKIAVGALLCVAAVAALKIYGDARWSAGYELGEQDANRKAEVATDRAIQELADDAAKARFERRLCRERGRVWSFANNKCAKG